MRDRRFMLDETLNGARISVTIASEGGLWPPGTRVARVSLHLRSRSTDMGDRLHVHA